jgi:hypothetical protein
MRLTCSSCKTIRIPINKMKGLEKSGKPLKKLLKQTQQIPIHIANTLIQLETI